MVKRQDGQASPDSASTGCGNEAGAAVFNDHTTSAFVLYTSELECSGEIFAGSSAATLYKITPQQTEIGRVYETDDAPPVFDVLAEGIYECGLGCTPYEYVVNSSTTATTLPNYVFLPGSGDCELISPHFQYCDGNETFYFK